LQNLCYKIQTMRNTIYTAVLSVFPCLIPALSKAQVVQQPRQITVSESRLPQSGDTIINSSQQEIIGTIVWLGLNNNWNDAQNWYLNVNPEYGIPTSNTDVMIGTVASGIYPVIAKNQVAVCNTLTIATGGPSITINNGADLNCYGDLANNGTLTNNGRINLMGVGNQLFPGPGTINAMSVVQVSKTAGTVLVNRDFFIDSALLPTSGVMALGNYDVTLRSTAARTSYVGIVGSNTGFTYNTGRFIVQRYISQTRKWQLLGVATNGTQSIRDAWQDGGSSTSSPTGYGVQITGPVVADGIDTFSYAASMKYQDGATQNFIPVSNTYNPLSNGKGYFLYVYGNRAYSANGIAGGPTTLQSRGKLFVGNQVAGDHPPAVTGVANIAAGEDHISVSNPFAGPINFTSVYNLAANSTGNFKSNFKVWDPSQFGLYGSGLYQTITGPTGWLATPGGGTIYNSSSNFSDIQSGQAFYVEAQSSGTVSVRFSETVKSVQNRLVNRGITAENVIDPATLSMLSSFVYKDNDRLLDGNRVIFAAHYENAVTPDDACKLWNQGANFAVLKNNKSLAVETRPDLATGDTIQFEMYGLYTGNYQLRLEPQLLNATLVEAFLIDRYLQTEQKISLTSNNEIAFSIDTNPASEAADRFLVVIRQKPLPVRFVMTAASWLPDGNAKIVWKVAQQENTSYFQLQKSNTDHNFNNISQEINCNAVEYSAIDPAALSNNFYRIKAMSNKGEESFSEIFKLSKASLAEVVVAPNPVVGKRLQLQLKNFENGYYRIQIIAASGAAIHLEQINVTAYKTYLTLQLGKALATGSYQLRVYDSEGNTKTSTKVIIQ
jgi:hypothetical protein